MSRTDTILKLHAVLIERRDALRRALAGDLSLLKKLRHQTAGDTIDAALDSITDEISSQLAEVESGELNRIEHAIERMRDGCYGKCESCGTSISAPRLNALPYATLCIECQREAENHADSEAAGIDWGQTIDSSGSDNNLLDQGIEPDTL